MELLKYLETGEDIDLAVVSSYFRIKDD